jgi:hypothetical protein
MEMAKASFADSALEPYTLLVCLSKDQLPSISATVKMYSEDALKFQEFKDAGNCSFVLRLRSRVKSPDPHVEDYVQA